MRQFNKASRTRIFRQRRFKKHPAILTGLLFFGLSVAYVALNSNDTPVQEENIIQTASEDIQFTHNDIAQIDNVATAKPFKLALSKQMTPRLFAQMNVTNKTDNLKSVFNAEIPQPTYTFDATNDSNIVRPRRKNIQTASTAGVDILLPRKKIQPGTTHAKTAQKESAISNKIASIQSGISTLLKAGTEMFMAKRELSVGKGDTLMSLLVNNDVPRTEAYQAIEALRKVYDPRDLNPRQSITVFFRQDPSIADPMFKSLRIEKDKINTVFVQRDDEGQYTVGQEEKKIRRVLKRAHGTINDSLYLSAKAGGAPDAVIVDMIKMYSWNVDFQRDIQTGDKFEVLYEEFMTEDGELAYRGDVLYAELSLGGNNLPFYLFKDKNGDTNYFDDEGKSAKKALMKTPINGARLSSGYGMRRHPVLGYSKMHKGVDFAAPRGTPIFAAGDGVVERANRFSSYGNYIRIRHNNGIKTAYAHLKGFKKGIRAGKRVKQGDVIGYVGSTGRSTGPHLHYEVLRGGKQINPRTLKVSTGKALAGKDMSNFKTTMAKLDDQFNDLGNGRVIVSQLTLPSQMKQQ